MSGISRSYFAIFFVVWRLEIISDSCNLKEDSKVVVFSSKRYRFEPPKVGFSTYLKFQLLCTLIEDFARSLVSTESINVFTLGGPQNCVQNPAQNPSLSAALENEHK